MEFNKVLITLDGSDAAARALDAALLIVKPGAKLHLFSVIESIPPIAMPFVSPGNGDFATEVMAAENTAQAEARKFRQEYLDGVRSRLAEQGYTVTTEVVGGEVIQAITTVAPNYDLLVMATHGRSGLGRVIFGSVTEAVLHQMPCPMLIAPISMEHKVAFERILVCLDGTPEAETILPQVEKVLAAHPAKVILMKVEPYVEFAALKISTDEYLALNVTAEMEARQYLEQIGKRLEALGAETVVEVNFNKPEQEIGTLSKYHHVDLIAMATHGRTGIERLLKGSVTEDVLHQLHQPMLVARMPAVKPD
jgi:nucleotide-binding universal stress UspA family protein